MREDHIPQDIFMHVMSSKIRRMKFLVTIKSSHLCWLSLVISSYISPYPIPHFFCCASIGKTMPGVQHFPAGPANCWRRWWLAQHVVGAPKLSKDFPIRCQIVRKNRPYDEIRFRYIPLINIKSPLNPIKQYWKPLIVVMTIFVDYKKADGLTLNLTRRSSTWPIKQHFWVWVWVKF